MGILSILLAVLGIVNEAVPMMKDAHAAFNGKKGSGKKKKKLVMEGTKALLETDTTLSAKEKKAVLAEIGKTVDTVAAVAKAIEKK